MALDVPVHGVVSIPSSSRGTSSKDLPAVTHCTEGLKEALLELHKAFNTAQWPQSATCVTNRSLEAAFNLLEQQFF